MPNRSDDQHFDEDRVLIDRFRAHPSPSPEGKQAFDELYTRHRDKLLNYCRWLTRDADLAEDITQQAFLELLLKLGAVDHPRPWLRTVARRKWIAQFTTPDQPSARQSAQPEPVPGPRSHHKQWVPETPMSHEPWVYDTAALVGEEERIVDDLHGRTLTAMMQRLKIGLSPRYRQFYQLHVREGLDGRELERSLDITDGKRRKYKFRFKRELERLLVTNVLATEALHPELTGCSKLRGKLEDEDAEDWSGSPGAPLPYDVVMMVSRHSGACKECGPRAEAIRHEWRYALPVLFPFGVHEAVPDRSQPTAFELPMVVRRTGRRLTIALVVVLASVTGGMAMPMEGTGHADTVVAGPYAPGALYRSPQSPSPSPESRASSSAAPDTLTRMSSGSPEADSRRDDAGTPKPSPRNRASEWRNGHSSSEKGETGDRPSATAKPGPGSSASTPTTPASGPTTPGSGPTSPHTGPVSSDPGPVAQRLVVHFTDSSVSEPGIGVSVAVNSVTLGTCFKTDSAPASGCTYTVHVGDMVRLTPFNSLVTWNKPCDGDSDFPCEFLVDGDITTWIAIDGVLG